MFSYIANWCTRSAWVQSNPPPPLFTDQDVAPGSQAGRVFVVTGGNSGLGLELVKLLYPTGATVYLACRSQERAEQAIQAVLDSKPAPATPSKLKYLHLDLNDLPSVKSSAATFAAQESRLDILWNNAGIGGAPVGTTTAQNIEGHLGVNCVGPLLFTEQLAFLLRATATTSLTASVRIVWTSSLSVDIFSPTGGVDFNLVEMGTTKVPGRDYGMSKCGNWFLAVEAARRYGVDGVISVAQNPGQLDTDVWRHQPALLMKFVKRTLHPRKFGAYTMLYAGFSTDVTPENNGSYIMPWGRLLDMTTYPRQDIIRALKSGQAAKFWKWCESKYQDHI